MSDETEFKQLLWWMFTAWLCITAAIGVAAAAVGIGWWAAACTCGTVMWFIGVVSIDADESTRAHRLVMFSWFAWWLSVSMTGVVWQVFS